MPSSFILIPDYDIFLRLKDNWQIYGFPSYYVLDSRHRVLRRDIGYSTQLGLWLRAWTI